MAPNLPKGSNPSSSDPDQNTSFIHEMHNLSTWELISFLKSFYRRSEFALAAQILTSKKKP
ncbi:hypothetical protein HPP92_004137 [Vanilla planifolia]|uniref:Uncharacterized protein n=1 Tax=Vanilla planifolia TaxID=51239 RepID=A0A835S4A7_VANPL|nr:hypothetical protein HPP92_004574 [Vanilla planifolia]KAG0504065.1 hypothetical protein HPP92_004137 [Vanilla planifolia]